MSEAGCKGAVRGCMWLMWYQRAEQGLGEGLCRKKSHSVAGLTADVGPGPLDCVCQALVHQQCAHEVELSILDVCHKRLAFEPEPLSLQLMLVSGSCGDEECAQGAARVLFRGSCQVAVAGCGPGLRILLHLVQCRRAVEVILHISQGPSATVGGVNCSAQRLWLGVAARLSEKPCFQALNRCWTAASPDMYVTKPGQQSGRCACCFLRGDLCRPRTKICARM